MSLLEHTRSAAATTTAGHLHAWQLLIARGLSVERVVAVDVDSILYVARDGSARTAWLDVRGSAVTVEDEPGFQAEPRPLRTAR